MKVNQKIILRQYIKFLRKENRPKEFIKNIDDGHCNGFTLVWLFARWIESQQITSGNLQDNIEFFFTTLNLLASWDGISDFSNEAKNNIDRLMGLIFYYQNTIELLGIVETEFHESFFDSQNRKLNLEYTIAGAFNQLSLEYLLKKIIKDNKLVLFISHDHSSGFLKEKINFFYYNPNNDDGETKSSSFTEVAEKVFAANNFHSKFASPLGIKIFSFDQKPENYPSQHELLKIFGAKVNIQFGNYPRTSYCNGYTPIDIAIDSHCVNSLHYFLTELKLDPNYVQKDKKTPLITAINFGFNDIVAKFLEIFAL